jgi:hypothetical protein
MAVPFDSLRWKGRGFARIVINFGSVVPVVG